MVRKNTTKENEENAERYLRVMGPKNSTKENEKAVEKHLREIFKKAGGKAIKLSAEFETGMPDRLLLLNGLSLFAETKTEGEKPRLAQVKKAEELKKCGFPVITVDTRAKADAVLKEMLNQKEFGVC